MLVDGIFTRYWLVYMYMVHETPIYFEIDIFFSCCYYCCFFQFQPDIRELEEAVAKFLASRGKIPIGWEEAVFTTKVVSLLVWARV